MADDRFGKEQYEYNENGQRVEYLQVTINRAYSAWLLANGFKPRRGQRNMIAVIAKTLGAVAYGSESERRPDYDQHVCLVEAGTGTGKTVYFSAWHKFWICSIKQLYCSSRRISCV